MRVDFALRAEGQPRLTYSDVRQRFAGRPQAPSLREVREAVLEVRHSKSMTLSEDDPIAGAPGLFQESRPRSEWRFHHGGGSAR